MKKKLLTMILMLACVFSLMACQSTEPEEDENKDPVNVTNTEDAFASDDTVATDDTTAMDDVPETEESTEPTHNLFSYQITIDGTVYQIPMTYSELEALGWTYDGDPAETIDAMTYISMNWEKDGYTIFAGMCNATSDPAPVSECVVGSFNLYENYFEESDLEILLPDGIQYGVSTKEDIIAAYGEPDYFRDATYSYKLTYDDPDFQYSTEHNIDLKVSKETGVLTEIMIKNFSQVAE